MCVCVTLRRKEENKLLLLLSDRVFVEEEVDIISEDELRISTIIMKSGYTRTLICFGKERKYFRRRRRRHDDDEDEPFN